MNFYKKYKFAFTSLSLVFAIAFFPKTIFGQSDLQTLSLENLLQLAKENSIAGDAAKVDLQIAQLNNSIFKASLKPQLSAFANFPNFANTFAEAQQPDGTVLFPRINNNNSALGLNLSQAIPLTGGSVFVQSNLQRFDDFTNDKVFYNGTPFRIGFSQPLFGFNALKWDKKIEPIILQEAEKKYSADLESINNDAADLFFNLLIANENLQIATSNKESNETLLTIAEEKYELGIISKNGLLQLKFELASAIKNKKQAEQSVRFASSSIYTFLGKKHNGELINPITPNVENLINVDVTIALREGLNNRFEQINYTRRQMEADRDVEQAKREGGLQADLSASFGLTRGATDVGDIYSDPQQQQFVQLQLNVPIVDWGAQRSRVTLAQAQSDFLRKSITQNKLQLEANIQQTVDAFNNLQEQLQLNQEMKQLAQERFDIIKESFVLGAISITDLTLAQREKDQTAREYVFTLSQYWQNYYELKTMTLYDFQ
ncbi:MAG: TolC family protein [Saprospiraceae bacterium]